VGCPRFRRAAGRYVADLDKGRMRGAPYYNEHNEPDWSSRVYGRQIDDYYGMPPSVNALAGMKARESGLNRRSHGQQLQIRKGSSMDWNRVEGNWKQLKGKIKEKWGDLTDDDLDVINGQREQLEGKIQERYGLAKDQVRKDVDDWYQSVNWDEDETPGEPMVKTEKRRV